MSRGGSVLLWSAVLGGGAFALAAFSRRTQASSREPSVGPAADGPSPLHGLGGIELISAPSVPAPSAPGDQLVVPAPSASGVRAPSSAPLAAWNRRTDDGGPPLVIADDVEALARVITSEAGSGPMAERVAVGWVARNRGRARRPSVGVARLVCTPCGESSGNARPFSSRMPATAQNRELAALILASPQSEDPTQGATNCFEPGVQDRLYGKPGHALDARGIRYCWLRSGVAYYGSVGRWDLFGPPGGRGARPVPRAWNLDGYAVCCYRHTRAACKGRLPSERVEG